MVTLPQTDGGPQLAFCVGTYVAPPPFGNDANPGTRAAPKASISEAIQVGYSLRPSGNLPRTPVIVASTDDGGLYVGALIVTGSGLDIQGDWLLVDGGIWVSTDGGTRAIIRAPGVPAVLLSHSTLSRQNSRFSGFRIEGGAHTTAFATGALQVVDGSPVIERVDVQAGPASSATSSSIALVVRQTAPFIASPLIIDSSFAAGDGGAGESTGAYVALSRPEIRRSRFQGGVSFSSVGFRCDSCPGATLIDSFFSGGLAVPSPSPGSSYGLRFRGDLTGVTVSNATIVGGWPSNTQRAVGVSVENGSLAAPCVGQVSVTSSTITGVEGSSSAMAVGVEVAGCSLRLRESTVAGATGGSPSMPSAISGAYGVICTSGSTCTIEENLELAGVRQATDRGPIVATGLAFGAYLQGATVALRRNRQIAGGLCSVTGAPESTGVVMRTYATIENNVIRGGQCLHSVGLVHESPTGGRVTNNLLDGAGATGVGTSRGLLSDPNSTLPTGAFVNNIILAGQAANAIVVLEASNRADLAEFRNNNLFGSTVLYRDENTTNYTAVPALEAALSNASGNLSADSQFVAPGDFHISAGSPNVDAGIGGLGVPANDLDGEARPLPLGSNPDIGPDEVP